MRIACALLVAIFTSQVAEDRVEFPIVVKLGTDWSELDAKMFRACNQIPDDRDAVNLFVFAHNTRIEFQKDLNADAWPARAKLRKLAVNYSAMLQTDGQGNVEFVVEDKGVAAWREGYFDQKEK